MPETKVKYTIEFGVDISWIEEGFKLDDEKAFEMINAVLRYANFEELSAKVVKYPEEQELKRARQEYQKWLEEA